MPLPAPESRTLQAVGARPSPPGPIDPKPLIATLRRLATEGEGLVAVFDARAIAGEAHLLSAWAHLGRARARGESRLRDRGAELALFVAGDDQLPRALQKVGIAPDTAALVLVAEKPRSVPELLLALGLTTDPSVYPRSVDAGVLERLGIPESERAAIPPELWEGLVLERVALLELGGASSSPAPVPTPSGKNAGSSTPKD
ncbi:MAG: hypothetical protein L3K17_08710 [Thermoplasmata archaeon]|nr:hypothetical protein [Thermoplasmata archaeon]